MCNILKKAGRRAKGMKIWGTHGPRNFVCWVLLGSGYLSSVWGYSVHFAKFLMLRFSKDYCSHGFHPISTKFYGAHVFQENTGYYFFSLSVKL